MINYQREIEAMAYREFMDISQAVKTVQYIDFSVHLPQIDMIKAGRLASDVIEIFTNKTKDHPAFKQTTLDISEDNVSYHLSSVDKGSIIAVASYLKKVIEENGFTFRLN